MFEHAFVVILRLIHYDLLQSIAKMKKKYNRNVEPPCILPMGNHRMDTPKSGVLKLQKRRFVLFGQGAICTRCVYTIRGGWLLRNYNDPMPWTRNQFNHCIICEVQMNAACQMLLVLRDKGGGCHFTATQGLKGSPESSWLPCLERSGPLVKKLAFKVLQGCWHFLPVHGCDDSSHWTTCCGPDRTAHLLRALPHNVVPAH